MLLCPEVSRFVYFLLRRVYCDIIYFISLLNYAITGCWDCTVQVVSKVLVQESGVPHTKRTKKCRPTVFGVQPNTVWTVSRVFFLGEGGGGLQGTSKAIKDISPVEHEETLHQRICMPVRSFASAPGPLKWCDVHDQTCPCMHWFGRGHFEHLLWILTW